MQASVHTFEPETGRGSVLRDDGVVVAFEASAWAASGLRHLRVGQRVNIRMPTENEHGADAEVSGRAQPHVWALWISGIGDGQTII